MVFLMAELLARINMFQHSWTFHDIYYGSYADDTRVFYISVSSQLGSQSCWVDVPQLPTPFCLWDERLRVSAQLWSERVQLKTTPEGFKICSSEAEQITWESEESVN